MTTKGLLCVSAILLSAAVTGCTPANSVQRIQPAAPCEVRVCTNAGGVVAKCDCRSTERVERQLREGGFLES